MKLKHGNLVWIAALVCSSPSAGQVGPGIAGSAVTLTDITTEGVEAAMFVGSTLPVVPDNLTLKVQVLLDRAGTSPGVIDGIAGDNVGKAIRAFEAMNGLPVDGDLDLEVWSRLIAYGDEQILIPYTVTADDLAVPFLPEIPTDFAQMAALDRLSYSNAAEMLSERFHMDIDLLRALNGEIDSLSPGAVITVAAVGERVTTAVVRLEADVSGGQLRGYDAEGQLVVAYPATVGSVQTPSPSGTYTISAIAIDAAYYYRPDVNFQQGINTEPLTLPPGPNNPIGTVWIDLSAPTYGIHGTPEPAQVDKTSSHGCIRLANWDVEELAVLVQPGVVVEFR